jgi:hypothetical protein
MDELALQPGDSRDPQMAAKCVLPYRLRVFLDVLALDTLLVCGTSVSCRVRAALTDAFMRSHCLNTSTQLCGRCSEDLS